MTSRSIVAISEDRQWLVVLNPEESGGWEVLARGYTQVSIPQRQWIAVQRQHIPDTGQSADEVLREWMEGRDAKKDNPGAMEMATIRLRGDIQQG